MLRFSVRHCHTFFFLYFPIFLRSFNHPPHPFRPLMSFASLQPNEAPLFCSSASDMALSSCFSHSHFSFKIECSRRIVRSRPVVQKGAQSFSFSPKSSCQHFGQSAAEMGDHNWSFVGGSTLAIRPKFTRFFPYTKSSPISASWLTNQQIASSVFTLGTAAVLPFYTLMVVAPKSNLTRKSMESSVPYVVLGLVYAYLLYLSWTPNTIRLMFASKYLLPELSGIAQMFSSEMTLASAWIHLLAVDLFAARQVYRDGLENGVETRHSVLLCLLFCPVGIVIHIITKALTKSAGSTGHGI